MKIDQIAANRMAAQGINEFTGTYGEHKVKPSGGSPIKLNKIKTNSIPFQGFRSATKVTRAIEGITRSSSELLSVLSKSGKLEMKNLLSTLKTVHYFMGRMGDYGQISHKDTKTLVAGALAASVQQMSNAKLAAAFQSLSSADMTLLSIAIDRELELNPNASDLRFMQEHLVSLQNTLLKEMSIRVSNSNNPNAPIDPPAEPQQENSDISVESLLKLVQSSMEDAENRRLSSELTSSRNTYLDVPYQPREVGNILRSVPLTMNVNLDSLLSKKLPEGQPKPALNLMQSHIGQYSAGHSHLIILKPEVAQRSLFKVTVDNGLASQSSKSVTFDNLEGLLPEMSGDGYLRLVSATSQYNSEGFVAVSNSMAIEADVEGDLRPERDVAEIHLCIDDIPLDQREATFAQMNKLQAQGVKVSYFTLSEEEIPDLPKGIKPTVVSLADERSRENDIQAEERGVMNTYQLSTPAKRTKAFNLSIQFTEALEKSNAVENAMRKKVQELHLEEVFPTTGPLFQEKGIGTPYNLIMARISSRLESLLFSALDKGEVFDQNALSMKALESADEQIEKQLAEYFMFATLESKMNAFIQKTADEMNLGELFPKNEPIFEKDSFSYKKITNNIKALYTPQNQKILAEHRGVDSETLQLSDFLALFKESGDFLIEQLLQANCKGTIQSLLEKKAPLISQLDTLQPQLNDTQRKSMIHWLCNSEVKDMEKVQFFYSNGLRMKSAILSLAQSQPAPTSQEFFSQMAKTTHDMFMSLGNRLTYEGNELKDELMNYSIQIAIHLSMEQTENPLSMEQIQNLYNTLKNPEFRTLFSALKSLTDYDADHFASEQKSYEYTSMEFLIRLPDFLAKELSTMFHFQPLELIPPMVELKQQSREQIDFDREAAKTNFSSIPRQHLDFFASVYQDLMTVERNVGGESVFTRFRTEYGR